MIAVATRRPAYVTKRVLEMVKILLAASSVMQTPSYRINKKNELSSKSVNDLFQGQHILLLSTPFMIFF